MALAEGELRTKAYHAYASVQEEHLPYDPATSVMPGTMQVADLPGHFYWICVLEPGITVSADQVHALARGMHDALERELLGTGMRVDDPIIDADDSSYLYSIPIHVS